MATGIETPAFVIDEAVLRRDLERLRRLADRAGCALLYSPKANALAPVLRTVAARVDGFACSSPFELRLVDMLCPGARLHLVSPLIRQETLAHMGDRIACVTFNSLSQWRAQRPFVSAATRVGLRVNPQLSFLDDPRYDPCRENSKLGVPAAALARLARAEPEALRGIDGLHFHNNCEGADLADLAVTARRLRDLLPDLLAAIDWINLGGGYLFDPGDECGGFFEAVSTFRDDFGLQVFIEPGAAMVRRCATLEATVHDVLDGDDARIAVLDTTVNHMPEVFEFQFEPDVLGHVEGGRHEYVLAGCTCLAGDLFGDYAFERPLEAGARVRFLDMGAYTLSKAHRFNGVALPTIYHRGLDGALTPVRSDGFDEFARAAGATELAAT